jgi:hypothetical protein
MSTMVDSIKSALRSVFVPIAGSETVQKLRNALGTEGTAISVRVIPDPGARESYCFHNVRNKVGREGGKMQLGWAVWQHSNLFIEAEPHAVFDPANGKPWIDCTPNSFPDGNACREILFIPDDVATYDFETTVIPDSVRVPLVDDPRVSEALKLSSEKIALRNRVPKEWCSGELIYHYSPTALMQIQLLEARAGMLLAAATERSMMSRSPQKLGRNCSCPCGSGKKYKRCCGR